MTQAPVDANTVESKAAFARRLGISRQAVQKYVSCAGFPVDGAGKVLVEAALEWLALNIRGHSQDDEGSADGGLVAARIELIRVQIARQKVALAHEQQESIPYAEARRALGAFMRMHRDMALQFAVRHGPAIAAECGCEEGALIAAISAHMRDALNDALDNRPPFGADA